MDSDILKTFQNKAECPVCGCIETLGSIRCVGCGAFHSTIHLVDRDAPPVHERSQEEIDIDPLAYSMGPNQKIIEEEFEQSEDVISWDGGSTDFSFSDDESKVDDAPIIHPISEEVEEL